MLKDDLPLILCIPVATKPDLKADYSHYESVPCPDCGEQMWLGIRSKIMKEAGKGYATCAHCAYFKYHVTPADIDKIKRLTDLDS